MRIFVDKFIRMSASWALVVMAPGWAWAQAEAEQQQAVPPVETPPPAPAATAGDNTIEKQLAVLMGRPGGLTAQEAAKRAAETSNEVRTRETEIAAARAETNRVLYTSLPRLNLLARYTRLSSVGTQAFGPSSGALVGTTDPPGPLAPGAPLIGIPASALAFPQVLNQYLLQASINVPLSDYLLSTPSAMDAAELNEVSAKVNKEAAKLQAATRGKLLYYEWVRTRLQVVVAQKSVEQSRASLNTAKTAFAAGRVSKADVLNAESLLASSELRAERSRTQAALSEERLRVAMHDAGATRYEIGEDLFAPKPKTKPQSFAQLVQEARRKRLELKALDKSTQSLSEQTQVSDVRGLPKLAAFGNVYYSRPNQRYVPAQDEWHPSWDVGVQLTWSPNDFGTSASDTHNLEAQRAKILAQRDSLVDQIQQDVLEAYSSLKEAELGVETSQRNLAAAEEAYRVQRLFYENGRGTTLELLDAEARLLQARIDLVNVRVAQHMAEVSLEHAVGRDVPADALR